jgi:hypothetical protein
MEDKNKKLIDLLVERQTAIITRDLSQEEEIREFGEVARKLGLSFYLATLVYAGLFSDGSTWVADQRSAATDRLRFPLASMGLSTCSSSPVE